MFNNHENFDELEVIPDVIVEEHLISAFTGRLTCYGWWRWPHTKKNPAPWVEKGQAYVIVINVTKGTTRIVPVTG